MSSKEKIEQKKDDSKRSHINVLFFRSNNNYNNYGILAQNIIYMVIRFFKEQTDLFSNNI